MREIIAPLSQLLKSGEISSVELTNKYINAIENDNPKYNAYVSTTFEKALENAKFAELCEQCEITFIGPDSKVYSYDA